MRILDSKKLISNEEKRELEQKLSNTFGSMLYSGNSNCYNSDKKPGNAFFYSFAVTKKHNISEEIPTAATNGKEFFWNPKFLNSLNSFETNYVMCHEILHVVYNHFYAKNHKDKNYDNDLSMIAMDYVVNGSITDELDSKNISTENNITFKPVNFSNIVLILKGEVEAPEKMILLDRDLKGKDWLEIYKLLKQEVSKDENLENNSKGSGDTENDSKDLGNTNEQKQFSLDSHKLDNSNIDEKEIAFDLIKAFQAAGTLPGTLPAYLKSVIDELLNSIIDLKKYMRNFHLRKSQEEGKRNDWTSFKKRFIHGKIYQPRKRNINKGRFLALLDTSGSMSEEDIKLEISQLQSLNRTWTGVIVPTDAVPYWKEATEISNLKKDLKRTKIVGGGGTVFNEFFTDFSSKVGKDFDIILVLTDGFVYGMNGLNCKPHIPVIWVTTTKAGYDNLNPPFGQKVTLFDC